MTSLSRELLAVLPNYTKEAFSDGGLQEHVGKEEIYFWYDEVKIPTEGMYVGKENGKIQRLFPIIGKGVVGIYESIEVNESALEKRCEEIQSALESLPYIEETQIGARSYDESAEAYVKKVQFSFHYSEVRGEE